MSRPKIHNAPGDYRFVIRQFPVTDFNEEELVGRAPREVDQTAREILSLGLVIYDIIVTKFNGEYHLMDGAKRILACQRITEMENEEIVSLLGSDHEIDPKDFTTISAKVFLDLDPADTKAWSIILNEQRSDNPIMTWLRMRDLKKQRRWEKLSELYSFNKQRFKKLERLDNLIRPKTTLKAYYGGGIALGTLFQLASLGKKHQQYCHKTLKETGKITGNDIKAAKTARATAILASAPKINMDMPTVQEAATLETGLTLFAIREKGVLSGPYESYHKASQIHLENGGELYRLIPVG